MKAFQALPESQRNAIMQQLGVGGSAKTSTASTTNPNDIVVQRPDFPPTEPLATGVEHKISGFEQVLIELTTPIAAKAVTANPAPVDRRDAARLEERRNQILKRNPYELSSNGILQLPGFAPISLLGLTAKEAQQRLAIDPMLHDLTVVVTVLRVEAQGVRALKPFGYEMFRAGTTAFVPGTDIPAPANYKLGAGDVLGVQLYGQQSKTYSLPVGRDGSISFPDLGPISVGGLALGAATNMLEKRAHQQLIGTEARVTLTDLRSLRVLVLGDAEKPGSFVVSSLSSVTNALFASGGVKAIGSLRDISVKRAGQTIRRLDLYDVLLKGDTSNDVTLQSGDVVFVPPVGATAAIDGDVRRPAIYELTRERTLAELVALAGGLNPSADPSNIVVERIGKNAEREAVSVDLSTAEGRAFIVRSGDSALVPSVRPVVDNGIVLSGHVFRPGNYAWHDGLLLSGLLRSVDELKPRADLHYVLVRRETPGTGQVTVISADLAAALAAPGSSSDIKLSARDRISVFDSVAPRDRVVEPLLDELRRQSRPDDLARVVTIDGRVNAPGTYPLESGMRLSDLLRAGGGLEDAAYSNSAELTSYEVVGGEQRRSAIRRVDLSAVRSGDPSANVELRPYDLLSVKVTPEWNKREQMELVGEVRFPGRYEMRRGETLSSILARAGGLTSLAFPPGAVFTREDLKQKERNQLDKLAARMQSDLASLSLEASQTNPLAAQTLSAGNGLLEQLKDAKPVGRLVVDLKSVLQGAGGTDSDVTLRDGDSLFVPRKTEEVSVLGEVQNATSHLYRPGLTRDEAIALSGGTTPRADKKRAYVVRADGSVVASSSGWLGSRSVTLNPGDTVVVPIDVERMRPLPMWTAITTIIYNLAIAATAIGRL